MQAKRFAAIIVICATCLYCRGVSAQDAETRLAGVRVVNAGAITEGRIAWYGRKFAGRPTASGERFDPQALTMAHRSLPFGTRVRVTNLANDRGVTVRVNDRGPWTVDRIGDVSEAAAHELEMVRAGVVEARLEVLAD